MLAIVLAGPPGPSKRPRVETLPQSALFDEMISSIGLGNSSVAAMHNMALAAHADGSAQAVSVFSGLGCSGAWPQNVERDLHRWLRNLYGTELEPHWIEMDLMNTVTLEVAPTLVPIIAPHELLAAMYLKNVSVFMTCVFGQDASPHIVSEFWERAVEQPWFSHHPATDYIDHLEKIIPLLFHYDGAESYTNQECHIFSSSSFFAESGCIFDVKWLICCLMNSCIPTKSLQEACHDRIAEFIQWSLEAGLRGKYPETDFHGKSFRESSYSFRRRGTDLPGGWRCTFGGFKADRKASMQVHRFRHNYLATYMCETCYAVRPFAKAPKKYQFENFAPGAPWRGTTITHGEYLRSEGLSPWRRVRGWDLRLNFEDLMHNVLLGHGADAVTSSCRDILSWNRLARGGPEGIDDLAIEFRNWCRAHGTKYPTGMFTYTTLGLDSTGYPEMHSRVKAAHVRIMASLYN